MSLMKKLMMENSVHLSVIYYTSTNGNIVEPNKSNFYNSSGKLVPIESNIYNDEFGKILFSGLITSIGDSVFYFNRYLASIKIPNSVTSIGSYTFYNCRNLTSIEIPSGITSIGESTFLLCMGLTNIEIPSGVVSIGNRAFYNCTNLTSIKMLPTTPPTLGNDAFYYINSSAKIYVPSESVDAYKAATNWSEYADKIQAIGS